MIKILPQALKQIKQIMKLFNRFLNYPLHSSPPLCLSKHVTTTPFLIKMHPLDSAVKVQRHDVMTHSLCSFRCINVRSGQTYTDLNDSELLSSPALLS